MLMPGSSSVSALRSVTADLLVTPICMSGVSYSRSSSSPRSTATATISVSLRCTWSRVRACMSRRWPESTRRSLCWTTACSGWWRCISPPCCCPCCCRCDASHCSSCQRCHCSSLQASSCCGCTTSSCGPVMCSWMPRATNSPRVSPFSRKIVSALFTVASALWALPLTSNASASMHMTEATLQSSSSSRKMPIASSVALEASWQSRDAIWIWATVQRAEAASLLLPVFSASATASRAQPRASLQSPSKPGSSRALGMSPGASTSAMSRTWATRKAAAASPSPSPHRCSSLRALSAERSATSSSPSAACSSVIMRRASASSLGHSRSCSTACASRATDTASAKSRIMK
mmetsp:Transcript_4804/g.14184  ORF Transcript_4804/g.14184 Transcript_4804/m.14184 type:complete len:348 (-) Transcript_4804:1172-2215(-)